jgi:hypothetical protein
MKERINILEHIRLWWKFDGRYYHKDLINGIKNLIYWFPVIWKDRSYDHVYIYNILKHKIKKQAECIGGRDFHTMSKRDSEIMMLVTRLIDKCNNGDYGLEYMNYHKSEYNFLDIEDKPDYKKLDIQLVSERFDEFFKKYPRQYKLVQSRKIRRFNRDFSEMDKQTIAMEIADENQNRCRKLLFKLLERNIERWWD